MGQRIFQYFNSYIIIKFHLYLQNFHGFGVKKLRLFYSHIKFSLKWITNHKVEKYLYHIVYFEGQPHAFIIPSSVNVGS